MYAHLLCCFNHATQKLLLYVIVLLVFFLNCWLSNCCVINLLLPDKTLSVILYTTSNGCPCLTEILLIHAHNKNIIQKWNSNVPCYVADLPHFYGIRILLESWNMKISTHIVWQLLIEPILNHHLPDVAEVAEAAVLNSGTWLTMAVVLCKIIKIAVS